MFYGCCYYNRRVYVVFMSLFVMKENNMCFFVFYYKIGRSVYVEFFVLIEEIYKNIIINGIYSILLWIMN